MHFYPIIADLSDSSWLEIIIVGIVAGLLLNVCLRGVVTVSSETP